MDEQDHFLLILADSQLPIGSFAYSSGLESASIHNKSINVADFLTHSISSVAHTTGPFLRAAYLQPHRLIELDDLFDANTPCQVARRASVTQGRALLKLIDKTFVNHASEGEPNLRTVFQTYKAAVLNSKLDAHGHFGVVFGLAGRILNIDIDRLHYAFLQSHAKAILSAAVRLSLIGPYESTHLLASQTTRDTLKSAVSSSKGVEVENCGQAFSVLDIWQGRHELLYSRIFSA